MKQHSAADAQTIADALRQRRLRVTGPRRAILDYLIRHHGPFSADELHARLRNRRIDRVTVYRTLARMEQAGLVRRCDFGDDKWRYEFAAEPEHHHHHIICKRCRRVETLDACVPATLIELVAGRGYTDITHSLEFFGVCKTCRD
ncbi:MAG: transcriptional repressor [Verrucomicrobiae bacterium]|nr:transcriptional repressor [Verrucomicrobiae bacterium]MDW8343071.1 Fur family transcriptional regulator [Verrucomicrobiae bacterium]